MKTSFVSQITALSFNKKSDFLVGTGPFVEYYVDGIRACRFDALPHCRVHGIIKLENLEMFIAFGSKYVCLFRVCDISKTIQSVCKIGPFADWIIACKAFVADNEQLNLVILFGHNFIQTWNLNLSKIFSNEPICPPRPNCAPLFVDSFDDNLGHTGQLQLLKQFQCAERCILYSGWIEGDDVNSLTVFSGTVFSQILVWKPQDICQTRRICGHEGVIFKIRVYPQKDVDSWKLLTVSDDRTCRLWNVDGDGSYSCVKFYGHMGRVWDVLYLMEEHMVISCSEDGTIRFWDSETGKPGKIISVHRSDVRCMAVDCSKSILISGGECGDLKSHDLHDTIMGDALDTFRISVEDEAGRLVEIRRFSILSPREYFVGTNDGRFFHFVDDKLKLVKHDREMKGIQTPNIKVELYDANGVLANLNVIFAVGDKGKVLCLTQKPGGMFQCAADFNIGPSISPSLVYASHIGEGRVFLFVAQTMFTSQSLFDPQIICVELEFSHLGVCELGEYVISIPEKAGSRMHTSVTSIAALKMNKEIFLAVGTSVGSVLVFSKTHGSNFQPVGAVNDAHGEETVRSIFFLSSQDDKITFLSGGRDGYIAKYNATISSLEKIDSVKETKGWIERITQGQDSCLYYVTIYNKKLNIVNLARKDILLSIPFNATHLNWDVFISANQEINLSFGKLKRVECFLTIKKQFVCDMPLGNLSLTHYHGRETRCVESVKMGDHTVICTGGEDCNIRLWTLENGELIQLGILKRHSSAVNRLLFSSSERFHNSLLLFSCGGKEEMYCWRLEFDLSDSNIQLTTVYDLSACPPACEVRDTRIMDISVVPCSILRLQNLDSINSLHLLLGAYSDGFIRAWIFDEAQKKFFIVGKFTNSERCQKFIKIIDRPLLKLFSAETSGNVYVWSLLPYIQDFLHENASYFDPKLSAAPELESFYCEQTLKTYKVQKSRRNVLCSDGPDYVAAIHKARIHALTIHMTTENDGYIITGGDDGRVGWIKFSLTDEGEFIASEWKITKELHSCSVKSLKIVRNQKILSLGADERIYVLDLNTFDVERCIPVDIYSVSDMSICQDLIMVTGIGFQSIEIQNIIY